MVILMFEVVTADDSELILPLFGDSQCYSPILLTGDLGSYVTSTPIVYGGGSVYVKYYNLNLSTLKINYSAGNDIKAYVNITLFGSPSILTGNGTLKYYLISPSNKTIEVKTLSLTEGTRNINLNNSLPTDAENGEWKFRAQWETNDGIVYAQDYFIVNNKPTSTALSILDSTGDNISNVNVGLLAIVFLLILVALFFIREKL